MVNVRELPAVLTAAEVARLFRVNARQPGRWADEGRLPSFRTPGGHRRFRRDEVLAALRESAAQR